MSKTIKDMVDSITTGDLSAANGAFDEIIAAKRADGWATSKQDFARTAFDDITPDVTHEPVDTGITGEPEESEEK
jgi:hypothetical protein|tara:strand:- start:1060 stop:1284 length:225 start_codon:yes stop_codon:yes gene_type:complete